jgi:hypothetical protein
MAWYDAIVPPQEGLSDADRKAIVNGGLLQAGLQIYAANATPGVTPGQAVAGGLLGGLGAVGRGQQQLQDSRAQAQDQQFKQMQQQDMVQQMQRRHQIQDLARQFAKPDGTFDQQGYRQALYQLDPEAAQQLDANDARQKLVGLQTQKAQRDLSTAPTREIDQGLSKLTQEQQPDGTWKTIATASRFAPQQSAGSALAQKVALARSMGASDADVKEMLGFGGSLQALPSFDPNAPHGEAYIQSLPDSMKGIVQAVVDGRYPIPTGRAAASPQWQQVVQAATQADPSFDAASYRSRAAARQSFTSGRLGEQVKALNTLAGHLSTLNDALGGLDNSDYTALNSAADFAAKHLGDTSRQKSLGKYLAASKAVGDEAAKVFAGGQSALADREEIAKALASNLPKEQLKAQLKTYAELVESRLHALEEQASQGLGLGSKSLQIVTPKARQTFQQLGAEEGAAVPFGAPPAGPRNLQDVLSQYGN